MRAAALAGMVVASILFITGCGSESQPAARVLKVSGQVNARVAAGEAFKQASADMELKVGGAVRTESEASARLQTHLDSMTIDIFADSYFEVRATGGVAGYQGEGSAAYEVKKQNNPVAIETPHGATAVLGTKFGQRVASDSIMILVESGKVAFTSNAGEKREITAGKKLVWRVTGPLPDVAESSFIESEAFFKDGISSFEFERR